MTKIAQDYLSARSKAKQAAADGEECYIVVAMGAAKGIFTDVEKAKEELRLARKNTLAIAFCASVFLRSVAVFP